MQIRFLIVLLVLSFTAKAQWLDTIKALMHAKPNIDARLETRISFYKNDPKKVTGVRLGLSFRRKLKIGMGYSWLDTDISEKKLISDGFGTTRLVDEYLKFGYICYYTDFVFHKTKHWQLSVPIQLGTGLYWTQYDDGQSLIKSRKKLLLIYEPGISVQYKFTQWSGLGMDICGRIALKNTSLISNHLNSPVMAFKYFIWFDQLYYVCFPKSKITQKYGPASW